jgi:hypothetical protein
MREALYNILFEFGVQIILVRIIKMCLNETYSKIRIGKYLSDAFPIQNGLKLGDASSQLLFNFESQNAIRKVQENKEGSCEHGNESSNSIKWGNFLTS